MPNTGTTSSRQVGKNSSVRKYFTFHRHTSCKLGWDGGWGLVNDESLTCTSDVGVSGWVGGALAPGASGSEPG